MKKALIENFFNISLPKAPLQIKAKVNSKEVEEGDIFFAIKGKKTDGHRYLEEVKEKKAALAIIEESCPLNIEGLLTVRVSDVLATLQKLARVQFLSMHAKIIAVTGSVGKSTTKEYIAQLLACQYKVGKTQGNQNSQIGLPLSLIQMEGDEEFVILEMAMTEPGQILSLSKIAPPDIAVLSKIDTNHIELFGSLEKIAEEKSDIFTSPATKLALIGEEAWKYSSVKEKGSCKKMTYSRTKNFQDGRFEMEGFAIEGLDLKYIEPHFQENLIPALYLAKYFNIPEEIIREKISHLSRMPHRFESVSGKKCQIIDDSYNISLEAVKGALNVISKMPVSGVKRAVFGAFVEQGTLERINHQILASLARDVFDEIYCIGAPAKTVVEAFESFGKPAYYYNSLEEIAEVLNQRIENNDFLFLKGGNRYQLWKLLDLIR